MNNEDRDKLIIETNTDVKWLKQWATEHKQTHSNYIFWVITALVAAVLGWFRPN